MKVTYRGCELKATREKCLGGWKMAFYSAFDLSDGYEIVSAYSDGNDTLQSFIDDMKRIVDEYLADPERYIEEH